MKFSKFLMPLLRLFGFFALMFSHRANAELLSPPVTINKFVTGYQGLSHVESSLNGDSAFLWFDAGRGSNAFIQRIDGSGNAIQAEEWYVGPSTTSDQIALDGRGNFTTAYVTPEGSGKSIFLVLRSRNGEPLTPAAIRVNPNPQPGAMIVHLKANARGQIVVGWMYQVGPNWAYFVRTFSAEGAPTSPPIGVTDPGITVGPQGIAMDAVGDFGVTWISQNASTGRLQANFAKFSNSGFVQSPAGPVSNTADFSQINASIAMASDGSTVVTWQRSPSATAIELVGQRFDRNGRKVGSLFRVNESPILTQSVAKVGMAENGNFIVTWGNYRNPPDVPSTPKESLVFFRQFRADGSPVFGEQVLYSTVDSVSWGDNFPIVSVDPAGIATIGFRMFSDVIVARYRLDTQPPVSSLTPERPVEGVNSAAGSWKYFKVFVPTDGKNLTIWLSGSGSGQADLYGKLGILPSLSNADLISARPGNNDGIEIQNIPAGNWYFGVFGATTYDGVTINSVIN